MRKSFLLRYKENWKNRVLKCKLSKGLSITEIFMNQGLIGSRKCDVIEKRKIMLTVRKEKKRMKSLVFLQYLKKACTQYLYCHYGTNAFTALSKFFVIFAPRRWKLSYQIIKVNLFWEGHKILRNLHQLFDWQYLHRTNNWWRFCKILWPSQNIWTLTKGPLKMGRPTSPLTL